MIKWNYDHQDYLNGGFEPIPPGPHRVRINNAEEMTSKTGRDMIKLTLDVSGYASKVFYYMVFVPEQKEQTNKRLGDIYASFGIPQNNLEPLYWLGKVGAAELETEIYEGKERPRVAFFYPEEAQGNLPPWVEIGGKTGGGGGVIVPEMATLDEEELSDVPF